MRDIIFQSEIAVRCDVLLHGFTHRGGGAAVEVVHGEQVHNAGAHDLLLAHLLEAEGKLRALLLPSHQPGNQAGPEGTAEVFGVAQLTHGVAREKVEAVEWNIIACEDGVGLAGGVNIAPPAVIVTVCGDGSGVVRLLQSQRGPADSLGQVDAVGRDQRGTGGGQLQQPAAGAHAEAVGQKPGGLLLLGAADRKAALAQKLLHGVLRVEHGKRLPCVRVLHEATSDQDAPDLCLTAEV